jgi:sn-glycerol 3-phosphate transport system permease protein
VGGDPPDRLRHALRDLRAADAGDFTAAWDAAPFARYFLNTFALVTMVLVAQFVLCTLAAFAFSRGSFPGSGILFGLVLVQLMIMPDILLVENYRTMRTLGLVDTILAIGLPYMASAFGIFLLRQTFKQVPRELEEAARVEGCGTLGILLRVYVPLAKPTYLAYGLTSVSYHWNNFLWPLVITNRVEARPLTVGLSVFASTDQGYRLAIISAATLRPRRRCCSASCCSSVSSCSPSCARASGDAREVVVAHAGIGQRMRARRVLLRLHHHPALVVRQVPEDGGVVDAAIAGDGGRRPPGQNPGRTGSVADILHHGRADVLACTCTTRAA